MCQRRKWNKKKSNFVLIEHNTPMEISSAVVFPSDLDLGCRPDFSGCEAVFHLKPVFQVIFQAATKKRLARLLSPWRDRILVGRHPTLVETQSEGAK